MEEEKEEEEEEQEEEEEDEEGRTCRLKEGRQPGPREEERSQGGGEEEGRRVEERGREGRRGEESGEEGRTSRSGEGRPEGKVGEADWDRGLANIDKNREITGKYGFKKGKNRLTQGNTGKYREILVNIVNYWQMLGRMIRLGRRTWTLDWAK